MSQLQSRLEDVKKDADYITRKRIRDHWEEQERELREANVFDTYKTSSGSTRYTKNGRLIGKAEYEASVKETKGKK